MLLLSAKSLAIFLGIATIAFTVSTIVLAVQKSELQDELDEALDKLDNLGTTTTSVATVSPTAGPGTEPGTETTPGNGGSTGGETGATTPTPTISTPTIPTPTTTTTYPPPIIIPTPSTAGPTTTPAVPTTTRNPEFPDPNEIIYRLPTDARPTIYRIQLHPDLEAGTYEGTVSIGINIDKETDIIALHSKNLEIFGVSLLQVMARMRIRVKDYYTDPERELLIIEFHEVLQLYTPYTLSITYRGTLNGLSGFYSSSYTNQDGAQK